MKFTRKFMLDMLYRENDKTTLISNEIVDKSRWSIIHEVVFKYEDKFYMVDYSVGATESQEETPWQYDKDIECQEVEPAEIITVIYKPVMPFAAGTRKW